MNVRRQALISMVMNGAGQVLMAVTTILIARGTSPEQFGSAMAAVAIGLTVTAVLDFGTTGQTVREYSAGRISARVAGERLTGKLLFVFGAAAALSIGASVLNLGALMYFAGPVSLAAVTTQLLRVPLHSSGRADRLAYALFVDRLFLFLTAILLSGVGLDPAGSLVAGFIVGPLIGAGSAWVLTPASWRVPLARGIRNPWRGSSGFGWFGVAISLQAMDLPLMSVLLGQGAAGQYGAVQKWVAPMALVTNAVTTSAMPHVARAHDRRQVGDVIRPLLPMLLVAMAVCGFVALSAQWLTTTLLGSAYADSGDILAMLAVATLFGIATQPLSMVLLSRNEDSFVAMVAVGAIVLQFLFIVLFASAAGALVAPVALIVAQIVMLVCYGVRTRAVR